MFSLFKSKKTQEVKILKSSKTLIVFPCRLQLIKNGTDSRSYEMIGYIHEANYYQFLYLERSQNRGNLYVNSIKIPIDVATRLINQGSLKTEEFSYTFEKI